MSGDSDQEGPALSSSIASSAGDMETLSLALNRALTVDSSFSSEIFHRLVKPSILK